MDAPRPPALILAGGLSRRMGRDKRLAELGNRPLLVHVLERLRPQVGSLAINAPQPLAIDPGLPLVPDTLPDHPGPLAGVLAGLRHAAATRPDGSHLLTVPADTPFLPHDLVARLAAAADDPAAIVVAASQGQAHPVVALWPLSLADDLETWLGDPVNRRLQAFIAQHPNRAVAFASMSTAIGDLDPFFNVNTPDDLATAERFLKARAP